MKKLELGIIIGRFQPFHVGHQEIIREGLEKSDKLLIVIGSHRSAPSLQNPFSSEERKALIKSIFPDTLEFIFMQDSFYDPKSWYEILLKKINSLYPAAKLKLFGHERDSSSYYLKGLGLEFVELGIKAQNISASEIRKRYFANENLENLPVPAQTFNFLQKKRGELTFLFDEYAYCESYKKSWSVAPYPVNFVTCDILLIHKNKFLVIERGNHPGKGRLALPGGFLEPHEMLIEGALRELTEETGLTLSGEDCKMTDYFGDPGRDPRGRIITHVFAFEIPDNSQLDPKASDDARATKWIAISEIDTFWPEFFSDHGRIIGYMLKKMGKIT